MTDPRHDGRAAAHGQSEYVGRLEVGPTGAAAVVAGLGGDDVAVVVDVLSFTTTLGVAVERGIEVRPLAWRDERAAACAREHDAVLAVGRFVEGSPRAGERAPRASRDQVTLSPDAMLRGDAVQGVERLVLPSPNGSTICALLADDPGAALRACAGGRELVAAGFGADVDVAAAVDASDVLPVLQGGAFRAGRPGQGPGGAGPHPPDP